LPLIVAPELTHARPSMRATFGIVGAGELAGVANGNPHNVDSFKQPRRHTWHGQALAILRRAKRQGRVTLGARAAGLRPATVTLPVAR
jgi:beta-galactosidase